jgi:hypothetical protein
LDGWHGKVSPPTRLADRVDRWVPEYRCDLIERERVAKFSAQHQLTSSSRDDKVLLRHPESSDGLLGLETYARTKSIG